MNIYSNAMLQVPLSINSIHAGFMPARYLACMTVLTAKSRKKVQDAATAINIQHLPYVADNCNMEKAVMAVIL